MDTLIGSLVMALAASLAVVILLSIYLHKTRGWLKAMDFNNRSLSSKYGKMTEQFMPFVSDYPWDPGRFRFLGSPIDGVQFADEEVVFVEFKMGTSKLTPLQRHIRELVRSGKVTFQEVRID